MKRKPAKPAATAGNPSAVLRAFAPEAGFTLTLDGFLLLEALGSAFATGTHPKLYDVVIAAIVMTDEDAVLAARRKGTLDDLVKAFTANRRPADIVALTPRISAAITAAFDPVFTGAAPGEKKSSPAPAGG